MRKIGGFKYVGEALLALGFIAVLIPVALVGRGEDGGGNMKNYNPLTPEEEEVIIHKGTEYPGTGEYLYNKEAGTYVCKRCGAELYRSSDKFDSGCGWPSFDDEIPGAVKRHLDPDGMRVEILCAACGAHLGHVFEGEGLTRKNVRHCVNSISLKFVPEKQALKKAYFAAGCFWGVEYWFKKEPGVVKTTVGYMGGLTKSPTYRQVSAGDTGHAEALEVQYDPAKTDYEKLARLFFEIHDFTQVGGQGPDIGDQYRSVIFAVDKEQEETAKRLLALLVDKGFTPATSIEKAEAFWPAEDYHQDYYAKTGKSPYCHIRREVF